MKVNIIPFLLSVLFNGALTLNILGVIPYQGRSHFFVFEPYLRELAKRGHNLTVISYFPQEKPLPNYHDISLAGKAEILENVFPMHRSYWTVIQLIFFLFESGTENCRTLLADENVQNLWKSKTKFDLVVFEQFNSDCALGLAYKLGVPVVGVTSHTLIAWQYARLGIEYNPAHTTFQFLEGGTKPTLYQRIERTIFHNFMTTAYKYLCQRVDQNTLAQYFDDVPPLEELARNMKFTLLYTHHVLGGSLLFPANVKEVGGYHVPQPKELPKELKKFIDESEHGVIYISFGSMLRATLMPRDKLDAIIETVSKLPQRVIWKWTESSLPGNPKNIYLSKWLPQNDILAHPKILAFYSHCGLLSTTEAMRHGVPMICMPIFGDQPGNAGALEESGLGVKIEINDLTKEALLERFNTVLNPNFRKQVKALSKAWQDRPLSAMDDAIYWTEYAARTANFTFRTRAADIPYYQSAGLDVLAVLTVLGIGLIYVITLLARVFKRSKSAQRSHKPKRS